MIYWYFRCEVPQLPIYFLTPYITLYFCLLSHPLLSVTSPAYPPPVSLSDLVYLSIVRNTSFSKIFCRVCFTSFVISTVVFYTGSNNFNANIPQVTAMDIEIAFDEWWFENLQALVPSHFCFNFRHMDIDFSCIWPRIISVLFLELKKLKRILTHLENIVSNAEKGLWYFSIF